MIIYRIIELSNSNTSKKWKAAKKFGVFIESGKLNLLYSTICFICYIYNKSKKNVDD